MKSVLFAVLVFATSAAFALQPNNCNNCNARPIRVCEVIESGSCIGSCPCTTLYDVNLTVYTASGQFVAKSKIAKSVCSDVAARITAGPSCN